MIRVFEMFAGYGGASFALKKLGVEFESIGYSEINPHAIKCYEQNHSGENFGDCTKINTKDLQDFDLLTGGFPCQPFSVNTRQDVRGENHKSYGLFNDILRITRDKRPKYLLLENVKGILGEKSKEVINIMCKELESLGYNLYIKVLNTREHGIPQNRERVYFVGILGENSFKFPEEKKLEISVRDLLEENVERREPRIKHLKLSKKENIEKFGEISRYDAILKSPVKKKGSNVLFEIMDAPSYKVSRQSDRIYDLTFSPCLTATGKDYVFWDGEKTIVLTAKECFRLMGFVNDEINLENIDENQQYKLAGNGWDINLVSKIFERMFSSSMSSKEKEE